MALFGNKRLRRVDNKAMSHRFYFLLVVGNILILAGAGAYLFYKNNRPSPVATAIRAETQPLPNPPLLAKPTDPMALLPPEDLLQSARRAINEGDFGTASIQLRTIRSQTSSDRLLAATLTLEGTILARKDNHPEAVSKFLMALQLDPDSPEAPMRLADSLRALDQDAAAIAILNEAMARHGANPLLELKLTLTRIQAGETEAVASRLENAIRENRLPSHLAFAHAVILHRGGHTEQARQILDSIRGSLTEEAVATMLDDPATPSVWRNPLENAY